MLYMIIRYYIFTAEVTKLIIYHRRLPILTKTKANLISQHCQGTKEEARLLRCR